jgi:hypothetical protein
LAPYVNNCSSNEGSFKVSSYSQSILPYLAYSYGKRKEFPHLPNETFVLKESKSVIGDKEEEKKQIFWEIETVTGNPVCNLLNSSVHTTTDNLGSTTPVLIGDRCIFSMLIGSNHIHPSSQGLALKLQSILSLLQASKGSKFGRNFQMKIFRPERYNE